MHDHCEDAWRAFHGRHGYGLHPSREGAAQVHLQAAAAGWMFLRLVSAVESALGWAG